MPSLQSMLPPVNVSLIALAVLIASVAEPTVAVHAQGETGESLPMPVLADGGADISITADAIAELDLRSGTHLTLERVTLQADTVFGPYAPPSSELIMVEQGSLHAEDERGFRTMMEAPFQMVLPQSPPVTWNVSETTTFLRFGFTDGGSVLDETSGVGVETLANLAVEDVPNGSVRMFIAEATLTERTGSVLIDHKGPMGIRVQSGSLEMVSPSGLEGTLEAGQSTLYASGNAMEILSTNDTEASAMLFGVTGSITSGPAFEASILDGCRNLVYDCTPPGSSLGNGDIWYTPTASLRVQGSTERNMWNGQESLILEFTYTNRRDETVELTVSPEDVSVRYENGASWENSGSSQSLILNAGEESTITWEFVAPSNAGNGGNNNVLIDVPQFGDIQDAQWYGEVNFAVASGHQSVTVPDSRAFVASAR